MARENIVKFEEIMQNSADLRARIKEKSEEYVYMGNPADERAFFDAVIKPIAEENGVPFTFDEVVELRDHMGELSVDELESVAGGTGFCFILGGSDRPEAVKGEYEMHACVYLGLGFLTQQEGL